MGIVVNKPRRTVDVVTDLDALRDCIVAANGINGDDGQKQSKSVGEERRKRLSDLVDKVDASTLTLKMHGLNSSQWNMVVVRNTSSEAGSMVRDWPSMLGEAIPSMIESVVWKTSGDSVEMSADELRDFVSSLSDTQTMDIITVVQELNTPVSSVPKEARDLI
jgi:hypothetical protein